MKRHLLTSAILAAMPLLSHAQEVESTEDKSTKISTEVIEVRGVRQSLVQAGRLKDVIQQTEILDQAMIDNKNALSLSEAIQDEPGVRVSNECSMCGVKRVMLNGLKGEHTTILVDGLPTHTLISGFYGVDAIATTGVDRIEIARGAGASLIAPEAVGGTINVITKDAYENTGELELSKGSHDFTAAKAFTTLITEDGATGVTLIGQYDKQDQEDHDENGVNEAPMQENQSYIARISHDFNAYHNVQVRLAKVKSEVFGGPVLGDTAESIKQVINSFDGQGSEQLFVNNDVRERFIGKPWQTTEWIKTSRDEAYAKWLTEQNDQLTSEFAFSYADHHQDSFYEGIDYTADDSMHYLRAKFDYNFSDQHFFIFGLDYRHEKMRSNSEALKQVQAYVSDSFDYQTQGVFFQDTYIPMPELEIAMALRIDKVSADFIDDKKPGTEIERTIVAPRFDIRYFHNEQLTSRFSAGLGYRAPLSFFETDHGILDSEKGYLIEVDDLERSLSLAYSLAYEGEQVNSTFSAAVSKVKNLAQLAANEQEVPVLGQLTDDAQVATLDWVAGIKLTEQLVVNFTAEKFIYDKVFKSSYSVAPIENRASVELNWHNDYLEFNLDTTWYGARDLTDYGYQGYNILGQASSLKTQNATAYALTNFKLKYQLLDNTQVYAGVSNLFDKTQIESGDTPLFYDVNGNYDVAYIYGALHGREYYAGIKVDFN